MHPAIFIILPFYSIVLLTFLKYSLKLPSISKNSRNCLMLFRITFTLFILRITLPHSVYCVIISALSLNGATFSFLITSTSIFLDISFFVTFTKSANIFNICNHINTFWTYVFSVTKAFDFSILVSVVFVISSHAYNIDQSFECVLVCYQSSSFLYLLMQTHIYHYFILLAAAFYEIDHLPTCLSNSPHNLILHTILNSLISFRCIFLALLTYNLEFIIFPLLNNAL